MPFSTPVFWALALAWLPLGILLQTALRNLPGLFLVGVPLSFPPGMLGALFSLVPVAPCGLPLALAWRQIYRFGRTRAAWTAFAILAPLTAFASLYAGLLGPLAIAAYAAVFSLPAWILYAALRGKIPPQAG